MYIKSIEIKNFRNYSNEKINFHKKVNLIIGENAQGKTNLLESLYFCSIGRSFRRANIKDLIKFDEEFCNIKTFYEKGREEKIEIALSREGEKRIKISGSPIEKMSELLGNILTVVFSPDDLKIVKDEPEKRRAFIDKEMCQIKRSYFYDLSNYKRIIEQRNAFLKEKYIDERELDVWDETIAPFGGRIIYRRDNFIKELERISSSIHAGITDGEEKLSLQYDSNVAPEENEEETAKSLLAEIRKNLRTDIKNRTSGRGPHKDDIKISINGVDARKFGSQGQQRTAALSLKLAEIELLKREKGYWPILLLDDVLSELDGKRQRFLVESLDNVQLFIASAELSPRLKENFGEGKIFVIKDGKVADEKQSSM